MIDFALSLSSGHPIVALATGDSLPSIVFYSLHIRRGSWFAMPDFGSRLHEISKVTTDSIALAADYCKEALSWLLDTGRVATITVRVERDPHVLTRLSITVLLTRASGEVVPLQTFFSVV